LPTVLTEQRCSGWLYLGTQQFRELTYVVTPEQKNNVKIPMR
jgi:hypothetical protein